ncbi:MAG: hypothetical protein ACP5D2_03240 [Candidatus Nanoarchaeia archaeon]
MVTEIFYSEMLPYAAAFLALFSAMLFLLGRTDFGKNRATATVIALAVSALAVYGLTNYTGLMLEIEDFFFELSQNFQLVIFIGIVILFIILLKKGLGRALGSPRIPWARIGIGGFLIFLFFIDKFISQYYLDDIFLDNIVIRSILLIAGLLVIIWGLSDMSKMKLKESKSTGERIYRRD